MIGQPLCFLAVSDVLVLMAVALIFFLQALDTF